MEVAGFALLIVHYRIDLVHVNMESTFSAAVAARVLRRPVIIHYRGKTIDHPQRFFDLYLPFLCRLANRVFVISHAVAAGFLRRGLTQNVEVLYNAVDLSPILSQRSPDYFERCESSFRGKRVVTFVGRLDPQKRVEDLIDAAPLILQKVPNVAFAIVGGDPRIPEEAAYFEFLRARIHAISPQPPVHFFGSERDVPHVLQSSAVLVLPSVNEGFGRVVVEAMAAGTPVAASHSGALPELLKKGELGFLFKPLDPDDLARAVVAALTDPSAGSKSERAAQYAREAFDIGKHAERVESEYSRWLKS